MVSFGITACGMRRICWRRAGFAQLAGQSNEFLGRNFIYEGCWLLRRFMVDVSIDWLTLRAMLPMYPKKPILTAGFFCTVLVDRNSLFGDGVISPILNQRIDWWWFIVSQIAFGLVAGFVVNLQVKVRTPQFRSLPFAVRAGAPDLR